MTTNPDGDPGTGQPGTSERGGGQRDRDPAGRARNARPRDGLGRPLPRTNPDSGTPRIPDDLVISPEEAAVLGGSLLAEGRPFHAHEVFEAAWKGGPPAERELWQGLAQVAVGITHARRGNPRGAATLLRRGANRIRAYPTTPGQDATTPGQDATAAGAVAGEPDAPPAEKRRPYGIDLDFVTTSAESIAERISDDGLAAVPEADLRFPLAP